MTTKPLFISLPVSELSTSTAFYKALGFSLNPQFSGEDGSCGMMLSLALESRAAVDAMNEVAAAHGGKADVNPMEDHSFTVTRDLADPDGHMWAALWMDPAAMPAAAG